VWVDDLVVRRFPVTNRQYLEYLHALVEQGRAQEALLRAPREKAGASGELGALVYAFDGRRFQLRADADGVAWDLEWPVFQVDWRSAVAFASWRAELDGLPWRLPLELEREKASRGVDGRWHPWGDGADPSWCRSHRSQQGRPLPVLVTDYPDDESVYGVRGVGGNGTDWCADRYRPEGPEIEGDRPVPSPVDEPGQTEEARRSIKGGSWYDGPSAARCASRAGTAPGNRFGGVGFRLVRSL
jgi:serine/threonine-protein kinase